MTVEDTRATMEEYFALVAADGDFSKLFADGITWEMVDPRQAISGRAAVRDYVRLLNDRIATEEHPRGLVVADGRAYLEGEAVNRTGESPGLAYCTVYDVDGGMVTAIRCYGSVGLLMLDAA
jgi:ketosteroid isomerase-like protein